MKYSTGFAGRYHPDGWHQATRLLTSTHFDPTIFLDFRKIVVVSHRANESIYLAHGTSPSPAGKGQHGLSQRGTWARKPQARGVLLKVASLAETLLLGGQISVPPNNPLILRCFGVFWVAEPGL